MTERSGNRFELFDLLDLGLLALAKMRRQKLNRDALDDGRDFYEGFFTKTDEDVRWRRRDPRRALGQEVLRRAAESHGVKDTLLVDVGCGLGDNLLAVGDGWRLAGVEYSATSAAVAIRRLAGRAEVVIGSATALPFKHQEAGVAICLEVLEHIEDDARVLREIWRVLAPGGVLIASVPYRYWFRQYLPLMGHFRHYTRSAFVALLERNGFQVIEYLPNCPRWNRFINYAYILCRVVGIVARLLGKRVSPMEVSLPWSRRPLIEQLAELLSPLQAREQVLDYSQLETSTFLVAQKV